MGLNRRTFLMAGAAALTGVASLLATGRRSFARAGARFRRLLRPPGALNAQEFLDRCIRCARCAAVCPNTAIQMTGFGHGLRNLNTPYIVPREQACMLCMKCTEVCPTGALTQIVADADAVLSQVKMGRAVVDQAMCYSYQGRPAGCASAPAPSREWP